MKEWKEIKDERELKKKKVWEEGWKDGRKGGGREVEKSTRGDVEEKREVEGRWNKTIKE